MGLPVKLICLLLAALSQHIAGKPPNPPAAKDEIVSHESWFEKHPRRWARIRSFVNLLTQDIIVTYLMLECIMLLLPTDSPFFSPLCPLCESASAYHSWLTPAFFIGIGFMFSGAALRFWCYQTLGSLFTFEITIKRDHKLVTSGPYAYVRHPSYTGSVAVIIGGIFVMSSSGSYLNQCYTLSTLGRGLVVAWWSWQAYVAVSLLRRSKTEDQGLKTTFGQSWVQYSHAVPFKFIPGII